MKTDISGRVRGVVVDREKYNLYIRTYKSRNKRKWRKYGREYNKEWRKKNGYHNETNWATKNPIKVNAHKEVREAVRTGRLKRLPCEVCNTKRLSAAHHNDYTKPLDVIFLCRIHHAMLHKNFSLSFLETQNKKQTLELLQTLSKK